MNQFDYIFVGGGLSTQLVLREMILSNKFNHCKILVLDTEQKNTNDRTWCFWQQNNGEFDSIVSKKWSKAIFLNSTLTSCMNLEPYFYKMIRAADFYSYCKKLYKLHENIYFVQDKVNAIHENINSATVITSQNKYSAKQVFNSIYNQDIIKKQQKYPLLHQHFIGWFVKTEINIFNQNEVTFMDFSVNQNGNTRFMYVLPFSKTEALVEYTLFSKDILEDYEYENEIELYLNNLGASKFLITETEKGNIPMTCYPFWKANSKCVCHIGSAGGWTKASTGYTFIKSTKKAKILVNALIHNKNLQKLSQKNKFWFYDLLFIDVLFKWNNLGESIFSALFKNGKPQNVFRFLDDQTTYCQDLQFILKCPKIPFIKVLFTRIFQLKF